ncbi:MAG TPA: hypothetical protein VLR26_08435 [Frankiaceae bacterium]|nr:hypothetical protein [Frankiaceae bacterium]
MQASSGATTAETAPSTAGGDRRWAALYVLCSSSPREQAKAIGVFAFVAPLRIFRSRNVSGANVIQGERRR